MERKSISWILDFASKLSDEEKVKCLVANPSLADIFRLAYDPQLQWVLPETDPPYKPCEYPNIDNQFYSQIKRLYLFLRGGNDGMNQIKRERLFIDILETIAPGDAKLLLALKNKTLPEQNLPLTKDIVLKAFPGLF